MRKGLFCLLVLGLTGWLSGAGRVAHATAQQSGLAAQAREVARHVDGERAVIRVALPAHFFSDRGALPETTVEELHHAWLDRIGAPEAFGPFALPAGVRSVVLWARLPGPAPGLDVRIGQWATLNNLMRPPPPVPRKPWETPLASPAGSGSLQGMTLDGQVAGALAGKTVYLSPGHGFTWTQNLTAWATQRGNENKLVEDLLNAESALHFLVPMLHNAGADVVTMRERDLNPQQVIVDDSQAADASGQGYSEQGGVFAAGTNAGFGGAAPWTGQTNPFAGGGYRAAPAIAGSPTGAALFVPNVPTTGRYAVYVGYTAGANRAPDAHYEVRHLGGATHIRLDQSRHGGTWIYLGHFAFSAGIHPDKGAVLLHNDSKSGLAGKYVIADVVRLGGGMGDVVRGTGKAPLAGPTSGRPRWEESCRTYAQFAGAPVSVYTNGASDPTADVSCRSRMAAWVHEDGEDAVFLSWHTNAPSPARGTSTYVYGPNPPDGNYQFTGTQGSDIFGKLVHKGVVDDIRALWDPAWKDRGLLSAWFGEINPAHNNEMPSVLVEAAFHSTKEDADQLREPRFRHLLARALYKAIVKYFAQKDGKPAVFLPEPAQGLALLRKAPGVATLSWLPGPSGGALGAAATSYLVQTSSDGLGFADVSETQATALDLTLPPDNKPLFARVVARNAGGAAFASAVVGAVEGCQNAQRALVVQGFSRLDSGQAPMDDLSVFDLAQVQRFRQIRMNTFDYTVLHVLSLAQAGLGVDSAERSALTASALGSHRMVLWSAGEQSISGVDGGLGVVEPTERTLLTQWLQGAPDRVLWLSGAELAYSLDTKATPAGGDWLQTWFGARLQADDAGTHGLAGVGGVTGQWDFDDGTHHSYDADWPDVLQAQGGTPLLAYAGGKGHAAIGLTLAGGARTLLLGFPLETVWPPDAQAQLVGQLLKIQGVVTTCGGNVNAGDTGGPADAGSLPDAAAADTGSPADGANAADMTGEMQDAAVSSVDGGSPADATLARADTAAAADIGSVSPGSPGGCGCDAGSKRPLRWSEVGALFALGCLWWSRRRKADFDAVPRL